jgi:hypothetical protein
MDWRAEFMSQEFVQYAAECRRMARLARKPQPGAASEHLHWKRGLALIRERLRHPKLSHARPAGRFAHRTI